MPVSGLGVAIIATVVLALMVSARLLRAWLRFRGKRLIECPESQRPAGVSLDAGHAALTAWSNHPELRLSQCSRWPERAGCGQPCLSQIRNSPEDCLVRNILAEWYRGKNCALCGRPFGEIQWAGAQPGLLSADKRSVEWTEVAPETLPDMLQTALPVCFSCHTANRMLREHPELIVNRSRPMER